MERAEHRVFYLAGLGGGGAPLQVTGGSGGLGGDICKEYAREGADVVIGYRSDLAGAEETAAECRASGAAAAVVQADIGDEASVATMFQAAAAAFPGRSVEVKGRGWRMSLTGARCIAVTSESLPAECSRECADPGVGRSWWPWVASGSPRPSRTPPVWARPCGAVTWP